MMILTRNKYQTDECIGIGGMAKVYRGSLKGHAGFNKPLAIKRILPELSADERFSELFVHEARIASAMQHPNIVTVFDFARDAKGLMLVMELIDGVDLRRLLKTGLLPFPVVVYIVIEILRGLDYVHELVGQDGQPLRLVHRDLSPKNVLVSWAGAVKVSDFGVSKAFPDANQRPSDVRGTAHYVSPEQIRRTPLDRRSDLFSVGAILYQLLTGEVPFPGHDWVSIAALIGRGKFEPPRARRAEIPADLEAITMQLLAHDRNHRPESAKAAIYALQQCGAASIRGREELAELMQERFKDNDQNVSLCTTLKMSSKPKRGAQGWPFGRYSGPGVAAVALVAALMLVFWPPDAATTSQPAATPEAPMKRLDEPSAAQALPSVPMERVAPTSNPTLTNRAPAPTTIVENRLPLDVSSKPGRRASSRPPFWEDN